MDVAIIQEENNKKQNECGERKLFANTIQCRGKPVFDINLGHDAEVHCVTFSECGDYLATAGFDKTIMVWKVFDANFKNVVELKAHKNGILDI